jgi:hypothetical protein
MASLQDMDDLLLALENEVKQERISKQRNHQFEREGDHIRELE